MPVEPNAELENALLSADQNQRSLAQFVSDIRRGLQHLSSLGSLVPGLQPVASDVAAENKQALALHIGFRPPKQTYFAGFNDMLKR